MQSNVKLTDRARALLDSPNAPIALALLAFVLSLPSLGLGFQLDDRTYLRLFAAGRSPLELLHEPPPALAHAKQLGVFAWWSGGDFTIHFLRPGAALSHWIEYQLWPNSAWLMHLTNCWMYMLLVAIVAFAYREVLPASPKLAGLAALMFTINDSHAQSVGWVASRHVVLATLFAMLAVLLHIRGQNRGSSRLRAASVVATALALLSAEFGVAALAYLTAYAGVFASGSILARLKTIAPQLAVGGVWLAIYVALGCGVRDAAWYRDPVTAPVELLLQGAADLPMWLLSQLGGDVASAALVLPTWLARVLSLALVLPLLALITPTLKRSQPARFFALGMLLSCVFLFSTVPQDRLLLAASFGGFGWLACFFGEVGEHSSALVRSGAGALRVPHLVVAPLMFVPMLGGVAAVDGAATALADAAATSGTRQTIAVNVPVELLTNAAWSARDASEVPLHQLYAGFAKLSATRPDARTLELSTEGAWGTRPIERMFTQSESMPGTGETRTVAGMRVTVMEVDRRGLPNRVRFEFPDVLESPGRTWLVWQDRRPAPWQPPAIGARVDVEPPSMLSLLF